MPDILISRRRRTVTKDATSQTAVGVVTLKSSTPGPEGPVGPVGPSGAPATPGLRGYDGGPAFLFNEGTDDVDPGVGQFGFDNDVIASVTYLYCSFEDAFANDLINWMQVWDDMTSTIRGYLLLKKNNTGAICTLAITGAIVEGEGGSEEGSSNSLTHVGYYKIPVSYVSGVLYTNADLCMIQFISNGGTVALPFQTAAFANPLNIDCTTYKDWICTVTGDTTINITNTTDGDAGMLELIIELDSSEATCVITLGTGWTKRMGATLLVTDDGADNVISWRKVQTTNVVYTIAQIE